ncbi:diacylglycerol kinase family protein [Levilactobacillus parabrevis]|uniref:diacylglycerol kinase family protein n=1 Tax=Levilactobacillus parabrevis TaxID=357278 RepID=UPI0021A90D91|nr:diacylglycerol kinase family protein [Levilactobacillus parabrevis]MCT4488037.1 diacylglycerol kinase family protein [Levilactobacillus parabrevis]MCT4490770.1 diacylglycerol kinase family protein [Levilactobacillus parabrevis]
MPMGSNDKRKQTGKNRAFVQSLGHAWDGLRALFHYERNFRKHLAVGTLAVIAGIILRLTLNEWLWLVLAIFLVLIAETLNTIVEAVVDLVVGTTYHDLAKRAKDVAAGGVLLAAIFAVIVGALVMLPALARWF